MPEDGSHVAIERSVNASRLTWPSPTDLGGYTRGYVDLRGLSWRNVREAIELEKEVLSRFDWNTDAAQEHFSEDDSFKTFYGLDLGIASAVLTLSAAKCAPVSSCSDGMRHLEAYPLVAFFTRKPRVPDLLEVAEEAGCGLVNADSGDLVILYSRGPEGS